MRFRSLVVAAALLALSGEAVAQWQVPDHTVPIGRGPGFTGFKSITPGAAGQVLTSTGAASDPAFSVIPGLDSIGFGTRALAAAATIGPGINVVWLAGYSAVSDGGTNARYMRIAAPGAPKAWQFQSADGQWWGLSVDTIVPGMVGAVGDGVADDTAEVAATCAYIVERTTGNIHMGLNKVYLVWPTATTVSGGERICDLSNTTGVTVDFGNSRWTTNNTFPSQAGEAYALIANPGIALSVHNFRLTHVGVLNAGNCTPTASGLSFNCGFIGVYFGAASDRLLVTNMSQVGGKAAVLAPTASLTVPVSNVNILGLNTDTVYYGINTIFASNVFARGVKTHNVGRSLVATSSHNMDLEIWSNGGGPFDDMEINVSTNHLASALYNSMSNIRVAYRNAARSNATASASLTRITLAQGTGTTTPATAKNIKLWYEVDNDANGQPPAVVVTKGGEATVRNYVIDGIEVGGRFSNYNSGVAAINMFNSAGDGWAGETVRNIVLRDIVVTGTSSSVTIGAAGITQNLVLENIVSNVNWTISAPPACTLRTTNIRIPNLSEIRAVAGTTSGCVTEAIQAAAGTYNWNLPTGAGTAGQPLLSGGGGAAAMTFGTLAVANGGTGDTGSAWTAFTSTPGCGSGTPGTNNIVARQKTLGKTIFFMISWTLTTIGTCGGGSFFVTLPVNTQASYAFTGVETVLTGKGLACYASGVTSTVFCRFSDASDPILGGRTYTISGMYEAQ